MLLLTCQVVGDPMPEVYWHKDGRELRSNPRVSITHSSSNGASTLYISRALLDDAGIYQVIASNIHGVSVYYAEIAVEPQPGGNEESVFKTDSYYKHGSGSEQFLREHVFRPERQPNGCSVAQIKCQVKKSDANVNWLRDEVPLRDDDDKFRMVANGHERLLIVNDVRAEDEGEYVCQSGRYRVTLLLMVNESISTETVKTKTTTTSAAKIDDDDDSELYFGDERSFKTRTTTTSSTLTTGKEQRKQSSYVKDM